MQQRIVIGRVKEVQRGIELVILIIINIISFKVVVALDKNYNDAYFWQGWCESLLNESEKALYR